MSSITDKVTATFNTIMNQITYTFLQSKVFLKFRNSYLKDTVILSNILLQGFTTLFDTFQKLVSSIISRVHVHSHLQLTNEIQPETDDLKLKETEIMEQAERINNANGLTIIAYMNIVMKMEAFGISQIFKAIQMMFEQERGPTSPSRNIDC